MGTRQRGGRGVSDLKRLPARTGVALDVAKGRALIVVNPRGGQVVDTWAFSRQDMDEHLSMEHSRTALLRLSPTIGDTMVSNRRRAVLTMIEDSSGGTHDTLIAACDAERYRQLGIDGYHDNCADNLVRALGHLDLRPPLIPCPLNLFMNVPVAADGGLSFAVPTSSAGGHVILRAEMDLVVVLSACPQDVTAVNGHEPSEVHYAIRQ
jgi:uncharacterized protein